MKRYFLHLHRMKYLNLQRFYPDDFLLFHYYRGSDSGYLSCVKLYRLWLEYTGILANYFFI